MPFHPIPGFTYEKHADLSANLREVELSAPIEFGPKTRAPGAPAQRTFKPSLSLSAPPQNNVALRIEELGRPEITGILAFGFFGAALGLAAAIISSIFVRSQVSIINRLVRLRAILLTPRCCQIINYVW